MISSILYNMQNLAMSMPTNIIILVIICILLKFFMQYTIKDCIKVIIGYLLLAVLLSFFGITMPSFITIGRYIKAIALQIWKIIW